MELGSGSFTTESGDSSTTSLHGLKFGQKIYFEDVGSTGTSTNTSTTSFGNNNNNNNNNNNVQVNNASGGSGSAGSSSAGFGSGRKVRGGAGGGGGVVQSGSHPPRCQVEGCKVDLSDAKAYYSRHKVCGMHSKSPVVIVAGIEQRFCQQCSRFHLLPEFDQGKRSCRRRLAGHNERRRKPPPGSVLATRYGRISSSVIENNGRSGGFLVDFSAYQGVAIRDGWPVTRVSERVLGNQTNVTTRHLPHPPWHNHSENPPPDLYLQCSNGGTGFSGPGITSGECFTGVADSSCALSLLSNQPWGSRSQVSGLGVGDLMQAQSKSVAQPVSPHGNQYPNMSWCFKGNEAGSSSQQLLPQLGLGPSSEPVNSHFSGELELSQPSTRLYMDLEHSRDYDDSTLEMHWSL